MILNHRNTWQLLSLSACAVVMVGCQAGVPDPESSPASSRPRAEFKPNAQAGIPITQSADAQRFRSLVASRASEFGRKNDPFALTPVEKTYDREQSAFRLQNESGGFGERFYVPDPNETEAVPILEPQPYRRLSGIVVGDSILALIEMGNGGGTQLVRPGQIVPGTEWRVVSIDEDKAVLQRSGNTLPKRIVVKLESRPPEEAPSGGFGGQAGQGGAPFGGPPGGQGGRGGRSGNQGED